MATELDMRASVWRAERIDGESFNYFSLYAETASNSLGG
jgi:hypothetical protein